MANGTITVTIATDEWVYPDETGVLHTVTNGQTFTLASTDMGDGARMIPNVGQSVTTTDGYVLTFRPDTVDKGIVESTGDAALVNHLPSLGDWLISNTATGRTTRWHCVSLDVDDADAVTDFTNAKFEAMDGSGRTFTWTSVAAAFA